MPIFYDPLISKLVTWGDTREHALSRMRRALAEYHVRGIKTTIPFFRWILDDEDFVAGRFDTSFIDDKLAGATAIRCVRPTRNTKSLRRSRRHLPQIARTPFATAGAGRVEPLAFERTTRTAFSDNTTVKFEPEVGDRLRTVEIRRRADGLSTSSSTGAPVSSTSAQWARRVGRCWCATASTVSRAVSKRPCLPRRGDSGFDVQIDGFHIPVQLKGGLGRRTRDVGTGGAGSGVERVNAPMPGKSRACAGAPGDAVKARQSLVVVEAMKMENELRAARDGRVREVFVSQGQSVDAGTPLVVVE